MKEDYPVLSLRERDRRWRLVRELMRSRGLDCLIVAGLKGRERFESYLTNEYSRGIVIFPLQGELTSLVSHGSDIRRNIVNYCQREVASWLEDRRIHTTGATLVTVLEEKGFNSAIIGVVGLESLGPGEPEGCIPYKTWAYVLEHLPNATFIDVSQPFAECVLVKSEEELELVRHCAYIGEMACEAMLKVTRPGVSEGEIYAEIMRVIFSNGAGASDPILILHSGFDNLSWGVPVWTYQAQRPRSVQEGDVVQAELFPRYGGASMETQQQMSVALKPVHPLNKELAEIARHTYEVGLKALRPGRMFKQVAEDMEAIIAEAGCWHSSPLIHSLGPQSAAGSPPSVKFGQLPVLEKYKEFKPRPIRGGELVIKPGMVFELEPNACRGNHRINIGGAVLVTEDGVEELNKLPTEMRVAD